MPTIAETITEKLRCTRDFFKNEQLCLKYSRKRYDDILRDALCIVDIVDDPGTNNLKLEVLLESEGFTKNYTTALSTIFNEIWSRAVLIAQEKGLTPASSMNICKVAIDYSNEIVKNMSICVVLTANENDANKLFEVLNDRALTVEDLELIKNHFYKEYCTKSSDSDDIKDSNINKLDELWSDKIFNGVIEKKAKLISYLSAVYLTKSDKLSYKDDSKLKNSIENNYSKQYNLDSNQYTYQCILSDFNAYLAVRIILDKADYAFSKTKMFSISAEQEFKKSISYRALNLLNALDYTSVIPALTNIIIATYANSHSMCDVNFETNYVKFIDELLADFAHADPRFSEIHKCAEILWKAAIKADDYVTPRNIAARFIKANGRDMLSPVNLFDTEADELEKEFSEWLDKWTYSSNRTFIVKILMLHLLHTGRDSSFNYKSPVVVLSLNDLTYRLDAKNLQLDHLEAKEIGSSPKTAYFMSKNDEKRQKMVNDNLGNFMILDAADNNQKKQYTFV